MVARDSLNLGALPIGLAHGVQLKTHIKQGQIVTWADVTLSTGMNNSIALKTRREMETHLRSQTANQTGLPKLAIKQNSEDKK